MCQRATQTDQRVQEQSRMTASIDFADMRQLTIVSGRYCQWTDQFFRIESVPDMRDLIPILRILCPPPLGDSVRIRHEYIGVTEDGQFYAPIPSISFSCCNRTSNEGITEVRNPPKARVPSFKPKRREMRRQWRKSRHKMGDLLFRNHL
jgi:hypothetical protein